MLQANIDWKSAFLNRVGQLRANFHVEGDVSREQFLQWMPYSFVADIIRTNFVADFFQVKINLDRKQPFCVFELPFLGLGETYDVHFTLIGKRVVDFLLL